MGEELVPLPGVGKNQELQPMGRRGTAYTPMSVRCQENFEKDATMCLPRICCRARLALGLPLFSKGYIDDSF